MTTLVANQAMDPTRTTVLRAQLRRFHAAAWERIGIEADRIAREADQFEHPDDRIAYFNRHIRAVIDREIAQAEHDPASGIEALVLAAYLRGVRMADTDARSLDIPVYGTPQDAIYQEDHRHEIAALLLLLLADFRGMVDGGAARLQSEYARGVLGGGDLGVRGVARKTGRNNVAAFVATAVVTAFNVAILARFVQLGIQHVTGQIEQEFRTAEDNRVCERCMALSRLDNGMGPGIYTIEQARGLIPVHRRCRCAWRARRLRRR